MKKILFLQYTNPAGYPPLEHACALLLERGWEALFLGVDPVGTERMRFPGRARVRVKLLRRAKQGSLQKIQYAFFCLWAIGWVLRQRPRWIYASDPLSCPAALLLSCGGKGRIVYHEHDSPSPGPKSLWMGAVLRARRRLARRAAFCVLPNRERAERFSKETGRPDGTFSVWNCPSRGEVSPPRGDRWETPLKLFFHGSLGPGRLPVAVLEAMASLKGQVRLTVVGYETVGHLGYADRFQREADRLGVEELLDWKGTLPTRAEMLSLARQADVGLALMPMRPADPNERWMAGASNKPFEYLACGLALLVSDLPEWRGLYAQAGYGLACDPSDPGKIAQALRWFLEQPGSMRRMGEEGRKRVLEEWNYENQFAPVLSLLDG